MLTRPVPACDPAYESRGSGIRQVKAISTVHLYRVIRIRHEDAHLSSLRGTGEDSIAGERPGTTIQNPGAAARNTASSGGTVSKKKSTCSVVEEICSVNSKVAY